MSKQNDVLFPAPKLIKPVSQKCAINLNAQWWENSVPPPAKVIKSLANNNYNCSHFKLFSRDINVIQAIKQFKGKALVAFTNWELYDLGNNNLFLENEIKNLIPYSDTVIGVAVGNEPLGDWYNGEFKPLLVDAVFQVSKMLKLYLPNTFVTVPFNFAIFDNTYPPSQSKIRDSLKNVVVDTLHIINNHSVLSPIMVNIYPYLTQEQHPDTVDLNFAVGSDSLACVRDNELLYTSLFSMMYDSALVAIRKKGFNMPLEIGEVGWPNGGGFFANDELECAALARLQIDRIVGTPRQPGPITTYLFEAMDEPWKDIGPGLSERHWGILNFDLSPKCIIQQPMLSYNKNNNDPNLFGLWPFLLLFLPLVCVTSALFCKPRTFSRLNALNLYYPPIYQRYQTITPQS
jgi:hypothetical protein